jgi:hypothetical protein
MKRTARLTKVENLPDEERLFIVGCFGERPRPSADQVSHRFKEKFGKPLAPSVIYSWYSRRVLPGKIAAEQAINEAAEFAQLERANPDLPRDVLLRGWLTRRLSSEAFREGEVEPNTVISARLTEARLDLQEREVAAKEEANRLKDREISAKEKLAQIAREKIVAAAGGLDPRELYLRAAQDVLKKLHTYKDLKAPLDIRQEEIVAELAHSAESFARKLEHES